MPTYTHEEVELGMLLREQLTATLNSDEQARLGRSREMLKLSTDLEDISTFQDQLTKAAEGFYGRAKSTIDSNHFAEAQSEDISDAAQAGSLFLVRAMIKAGADINHVNKKGYTALLIAICNDDAAAVNLLMRAGAEINRVKGTVGASLNLAVVMKNVEIIRLLIKNEADLDGTDMYGHTPLCNAAMNGCSEIVEILVDAGADVHTDDPYHNPAMLAALRGHLETLEILLDAGANPSQVLAWLGDISDISLLQFLLDHKADVNYLDEKFGTGLIRACMKGSYEGLQFFLDHGADPNLTPGKSTALHECAREGYAKFIPLLVKHGADTNVEFEGFTPLLLAIAHKHIDCVRELLKAKANPEIPEKGTAVNFARKLHHSDILALLQSYGAFDFVHDEKEALRKAMEMADKGQRATLRKLLDRQWLSDDAYRFALNTALLLASARGHRGIVQDLINLDADPNCSANLEGKNGTQHKGTTPLLIAMSEGHYHLIDTLIKAGADINKIAGSGLAPLHMAAKLGQIAVVKQLLRLGADVGIKGLIDRTPLVYAIGNKHFDVVLELLNSGADPRYQDKDGVTPLMIAAEYGHDKIGSELIERKANLNTQDKLGRTALMYAVNQAHVDFVEILLAADALTYIKDRQKKTALDYALEAGNQEIIKLLS